MAKKKKKNRAQAAAARYEQTPESIKRAKTKERTELIKKSAQAAQQKASKTAGFRALMPFLIGGAIILAAVIFTIGPGLMMTN